VQRFIISLAGLFFLVATADATAQEVQTGPTVPVAAAAQTECSGFFGPPVPRDIWVFDGADNDLRSQIHQFQERDFVYLGGKAGNLTVGSEFRLLRPASEIFRTIWYDHQHLFMHVLGTPYEDVGRVRVARVTPNGAVAQVVFGCQAAQIGDIASPYQPRPIPEYAPGLGFDRFASSNGHLEGAILAARNNASSLGKGTIVYVDLSAGQGVKVGQRFLIYHNPGRHREIPREALGELIILSANQKSSVGIIVRSIREISLGDGVQLE
jgi:hypothetical protein